MRAYVGTALCVLVIACAGLVATIVVQRWSLEDGKTRLGRVTAEASALTDQVADLTEKLRKAGLSEFEVKMKAESATRDLELVKRLPRARINNENGDLEVWAVLHYDEDQMFFIQHGPTVKYWESGIVESEVKYTDGVPDDQFITKADPMGGKSAEGWVRQGKRDGTWVFYSMGQEMFRQTYKEGIAEGDPVLKRESAPSSQPSE